MSADSNIQTWRASFLAAPERAEGLALQLELLSDSLGAIPPTFSWVEESEDANWLMEVWFAGKPEPDFIESWFKACDMADTAVTLELLEEKDWVSESQKLLEPVDAGRYFIHGAHDRDQARPGRINLQIDAGQAFGTGKHETTSGCLMMLDKLARKIKPRNVLDLGTGSGVLGLAAARTWRTKVVGSDIDPIAIEVAAPNGPLNNVRTRAIGDRNWGYKAVIADGLNNPVFRKEGPFDLIIANILAEPLVDLAPSIIAALAPSGYLILAGLLDSQEAMVRTAYRGRGLIFMSRKNMGSWPTLLLRKPR